MVVFKDNTCLIPSHVSYYRTASNSAINTDSLMRQTTIEQHINPKRFVWRCRPYDEEYRAITLSICVILNDKYVTKIPRFLFHQLSDHIVNGDIPIWNFDQLFDGRMIIVGSLFEPHQHIDRHRLWRCCTHTPILLKLFSTSSWFEYHKPRWNLLLPSF